MKETSQPPPALPKSRLRQDVEILKVLKNKVKQLKN